MRPSLPAIVAALAAALAAQCAANIACAAEAPGSVALDGLSFRRGTLTIDIPHLEASGTTLTAPELRAILDPSSDLTPAQRLARLSAASIAAQEVTFRRDPKAGEAQGQAVTLHGLRLADVVAGKAAAVSVASLDGDLRSGPDERDAVSTGGIAAHAVDPLLALDMATGSRTDADLPVATVCGDLAISDLRFHTSGDDALAVEKIEIAGLRGRPLRDTPSNVLRLFNVAPGLTSDADKARSLTLLVDALASVGLDRLAVSGSSFTGGHGAEYAAQVGKLELDDLRPASVGRLEIDDVSVKAGGVLGALHRMSASNIQGSTAMSRLLALSLDIQPAGGLTPPAAGAARSEASLEGLTLDIPSGDDGPFAPGTVNHIAVPRMESGASTAVGTGVVEGHLRGEVRYDLPPGDGDSTLQMVRDLGLGHVDAHLGYGITYDVKAGTIRLDDFSIEDRDAGRVALSGRMAGLPTAELGAATTRDQQAELFAGSQFQSMSATVVDRGLLGRLVTVMARQGAVTPAQFRAGLVSQVDAGLPELLGRSKTEAGVAAAIDRFLQGGGTLELTAEAPAGIPLREIGGAADPAAVIARMTVAAKAHP